MRTFLLRQGRRLKVVENGVPSLSERFQALTQLHFSQLNTNKSFHRGLSLMVWLVMMDIILCKCWLLIHTWNSTRLFPTFGFQRPQFNFGSKSLIGKQLQNLTLIMFHSSLSRTNITALRPIGRSSSSGMSYSLHHSVFRKLRILLSLSTQSIRRMRMRAGGGMYLAGLNTIKSLNVLSITQKKHGLKVNL